MNGNQYDNTKKDAQTVDLGFAHLDGDREARTGQPETIFCQGKTPDQVAEILEQLLAMYPVSNIMGTRADEAHYLAARSRVPEVCYDRTSRILYVQRNAATDGRRVAVVSAGTADMPVAEEAARCVSLLGHGVERVYDVGIAGVHRLLAYEDAQQLRERRRRRQYRQRVRGCLPGGQDPENSGQQGGTAGKIAEEEHDEQYLH